MPADNALSYKLDSPKGDVAQHPLAPPTPHHADAYVIDENKTTLYFHPAVSACHPVPLQSPQANEESMKTITSPPARVN